MLLSKKELENTEDNWLISYSDMMTLLLFLFIILYAMSVQKQGDNQIKAESSPTVSVSGSSSQSSVDEKSAYYYIDKSSSSKNSVSKSTVSKKSTASESTATKSTVSKSSTNKVSVSKGTANQSSAGKKPTYNEVESFVESNSLKSNVSVKQVETGIVFDIQAEVLFDEGSSQIKPESYAILDKISKYIGSLSNDIIIAGHTDNQAVETANYQSNWELSCDRATKVLRYFTDTQKLAPQRFQAVGYGGYRPIADNSTAGGRQQNRRVEVIIVEVP